IQKFEMPSIQKLEIYLICSQQQSRKVMLEGKEFSLIEQSNTPGISACCRHRPLVSKNSQNR
ncbi:MAG: hypothetical protein ACYTX0_54530, partial [Nostoc sp.]